MSEDGPSVVLGTLIVLVSLVLMAGSFVECGQCVGRGGTPVENYWGWPVCVEGK